MPTTGMTPGTELAGKVALVTGGARNIGCGMSTIWCADRANTFRLRSA